jgi:hypothetical protein
VFLRETTQTETARTSLHTYSLRMESISQMSNRMKSFDRYATWATARRSAGMRASSVIIPQEQNYVLTLSIPSSHASRGRPPHVLCT